MSTPIPIVEKFPYNELDSTTNKETGKRYYTSPTGEKLASVTTILGHTMDKTFLVEWRKRIGDKAADQIVKEASAAGAARDSYLNYALEKKCRRFNSLFAEGDRARSGRRSRPTSCRVRKSAVCAFVCPR